MEDNAPLMTREQYVEMLIDASFQDAAEIESGFMSWCERHIPVWRKQGYDETWVRQRIEIAQIARNLHRVFKQQGLTMLEIRDEIRKAYADHPELYDLAVERERLHPSLLRYRGNTSDLRQRYTLRVLVYETDKLAYEKFCLWSDQPVPSSESIFCKQPDSIRVVRDLSTVEELEMALAMSRYMLQLFGAPEKLSQDQLPLLMETYGKHLRANFIAKHGYQPEDSATPYVPVTIDGPQDHDAYYHLRLVKPLALAMGIQEAFLSTGEAVGNPKFYARDEKRLAKAQRRHAKKKKGSRNREKARRKVARVHARIQDRRRDYQHKLSTRIVHENQVICVESLAVKNMVKNHCLAKAISDVGWGEFVRQLEYKSQWYGRTLVKIDRWYPSSKTCYNCKHVVEELPLDVREWVCPKCGVWHDRDLNAANNILAEGLSVSACGGGVRPARAKARVGNPQRSRKARS